VFIRRLLREKVERDFGRKVEWVAIDHYNASHADIHLLIRGVDADGQELRIDESYLWKQGGLRQRARELATQMLGLRTGEEIQRSLERAAHSPEWTRLDITLEKQRTGNVVHIGCGQEWKRKRLHVLQERGYAWQVGEDAWEMSSRWNPREFDALRKERRQHARERSRELEQELSW